MLTQCTDASCRIRKHAGLDAYPPLQVMFATKAKNRGKLDSHCWFFDAFSQAIQPEICMLFDAGTRPKPFALRNIYAYFQRYPNVGAVTGELTVERPVRVATVFSLTLMHCPFFSVFSD